MNKNEIYIKSGTDYKEMTKELLAQCNLASIIADRERQIGIKPNLVSPSEASWGATTHPEIVAGIIEYLQENGYRNIAILEGSWVGDKTMDAFYACGYDRLCDEYGVVFHDTQKDKNSKFSCAVFLPEKRKADPFSDVDSRFCFPQIWTQFIQILQPDIKRNLRRRIRLYLPEHNFVTCT